MHTPIIDSEFEKLIPTLAPEEYTGLENSLLSEGCRDALVVWEETGILLDGHNRLSICNTRELDYDIAEISLPDRNAAKLWIYDNQLARRNLADEYRTYILGARYELEKSPHGGDRKSNHQNEDLKTAERIANKYGISSATVERAAKYKQAIDRITEHSQEIKDAILRSEIKVGKKDVIQFGAVQRDNPELGKLAVDELLSGNVSGFKHAIYNGRKAQRQPPTTITIDAVDMEKAAQTIRDKLSGNQIAVLIAALL